MQNYILHNGKIVTGEGITEGSVFIEDGRIRSIVPMDKMPEDPSSACPGYKVIDLGGKAVFAGGIDAHVHFREPGMTHKADIRSESLAALTGGVTSFIDMPNTNPPTTSAKALAAKLELAEGRSFANYGFHIGATNDNFGEILEILEKGKDGVTGRDFGGIKIFMGSSTGNMLVDNEAALEKFFGIKEKVILVHCEDEKTVRENLLQAEKEYGEDIPVRMHEQIRSRRACILSSAKALETALKYGTRLHLLHISTMEETEMLRAARLSSGTITGETSANYLYFSDKDYDTLGTLVKCNPSIKTAADRDALRHALTNGKIDVIATDHAPHLLKDKEGGALKATSGMPMLQFSLVTMLELADQGVLTIEQVVEKMCHAPASLFGIERRGYIRPGYQADLVMVRQDSPWTVSRDNILSKCGWSPMEGHTYSWQVERTFVNGHQVYELGRVDDSCRGQALTFNRN